MRHGLGRVARGLILLGVLAGHGLLLALPGPTHAPLAALPDLQVMLDTASRQAAVPAAGAERRPSAAVPLPEKHTPAVAAKPRAAMPSPRLALPAPVAPQPIAIPSNESTLAAMPVLQALPSGAAEKNTDAAGSGRETKPAAGGSAAPVVRTVAACDTRLLDSDYPSSARRDELEGRVVVQVRVLPSGRVQEPKVVKGSGFAVLDAAALRASAHWRCTPARQNGEAVESQVAVPVVFRLDEAQ